MRLLKRDIGLNQVVFAPREKWEFVYPCNYVASSVNPHLYKTSQRGELQ